MTNSLLLKMDFSIKKKAPKPTKGQGSATSTSPPRPGNETRQLGNQHGHIPRIRSHLSTETLSGSHEQNHPFRIHILTARLQVSSSMICPKTLSKKQSIIARKPWLSWTLQLSGWWSPRFWAYIMATPARYPETRSSCLAVTWMCSLLALEWQKMRTQF